VLLHLKHDTLKPVVLSSFWGGTKSGGVNVSDPCKLQLKLLHSHSDFEITMYNVDMLAIIPFTMIRPDSILFASETEQIFVSLTESPAAFYIPKA
jgi:hypothetical protein